ncbi:MAG: hypothetical protein A2808_01955 [Candidatus Moranbacteria bacterium RIFCSPHIGHO2_01_FULL_55_24]|nr:MAG: hypothetical protein A2808_01955 [Candidatus Moranbacteria bacterium RIFCSPHIGHO2_01_FULL_55_24]
MGAIKVNLKPVLGAILVAGFLFASLPWTVSGAETTQNLDKALKSGKKNIQFSGKENDDVKIRKGVAVIGSSPDKAIINGDIEMENGSSLQNVTVNGNVVPITVDKGASVTLINVTVRGGKDTGIYAPKGGGTLTVRNSRITKNRKGLFILEGKALRLSGNQISGNGEEGLDVHAFASGSIAGNTFSGNGEGGAEIIINGSSLTVSGNTFNGNKSSGLALQTYGGSSKAGKISINNNTFVGNGNFGIDCKNPSGSGGLQYFRQTARAVGNKFSGNGLGPISQRCSFGNQAEIPKEDIAENDSETEESLETEEGELAEEAEVEQMAKAGSFPQPGIAESLLVAAARFEEDLEAANTPKAKYERVVSGVDRAFIREKEAELEALRLEKNSCYASDALAQRDACTADEVRIIDETLDYGEMLLRESRDRFGLFSWETLREIFSSR